MITENESELGARVKGEAKSAGPDVRALIAEFRRAAPWDGNNLKANEDVRFCRWAGKNPDGKKHGQSGKGAFPWELASDLDPHLADELIELQVAVSYLAFWKAWLALKAGGTTESNYAVKLADWIINQHLDEELGLVEVELSEQFRLTYGWVVMYTQWVVEISLRYEKLGMAEVLERVGKMGAGAMAGAAPGEGTGPTAGMLPSNLQAQTGGNGEAMAASLPPQSIMAGGPGGMPLPIVGGMPMASGAGDVRGLTSAATDDLTAAAVEAMIGEPIYEDQVVAILGPVFEGYRQEGLSEISEAHAVEVPAMSEGAVRRAVKDLRMNGECEIATPFVVKNGPEISALKPWRDVVLKSTVADAKKSRMVWHREYIDEAEADGRIATRKWNKGFVEALKQQKGKLSSWVLGGGPTVDDTKPTSLTGAMSGEGQAWNYCEPEGMKDMMEVVTAVYRQNDENGVPGIWATVFHPNIGTGTGTGNGDGRGLTSAATEYAEHGLVDGSEGKMPYVVGRREVPDRPVVASRGLPQVTNAWQRTEKALLDGMLDLLSVGVHPPQEIYENVFSSKYVWAPGEHNLVKKGFEPRFPDVPMKGLAPSEAMIELCERRAGRRAGRRHADIDPSESAAIMGKNTQTFLMMWSAVLKQAVCLCQAHMPDEEFARITGAPEGWLEERRYHRNLMGAKLEFDIRELDPEYVRELIKTINEGILPQDVMGVTNRSKLTRWTWQMVNPRLARELADEDGSASQRMMDDVMLQVALMWQGNEPKYVENDASAGQKLNFLQQIVMANPLYAGAIQGSTVMNGGGGGGGYGGGGGGGYGNAGGTPAGATGTVALPGNGGGGGTNPRFVELVQKYMMHLMFQKEQMVDNRQIGKIGVKPGETE